MKNQLWGYIRYLLLGIITATALLWSLTVVPAVASAPMRLSDSGVVSGTLQNDGIKRLALSLPFTVDSQWTSVDTATPGIVWTAGDKDIKFGIQNGQFVAGEPKTDTWFIYGWFGALSAIKQPYNVKYPEWGDRHDGIDFAGQEGI